MSFIGMKNRHIRIFKHDIVVIAVHDIYKNKAVIAVFFHQKAFSMFTVMVYYLHLKNIKSKLVKGL